MISIEGFRVDNVVSTPVTDRDRIKNMFLAAKIAMFENKFSVNVTQTYRVPLYKNGEKTGTFGPEKSCTSCFSFNEDGTLKNFIVFDTDDW